jgi:hypothetical protein
MSFAPTADQVPAVGTKGYHCVGSDTYPVTAVEVSKKGKWVKFRTEKFVGDKENGHDYFGEQKWIITEDPKGRVETAYWSAKRQRYVVDSSSVFFKGQWFARKDPSF